MSNDKSGRSEKNLSGSISPSRIKKIDSNSSRQLESPVHKEFESQLASDIHQNTSERIRASSWDDSDDEETSPKSSNSQKSQRYSSDSKKNEELESWNINEIKKQFFQSSEKNDNLSSNKAEDDNFSTEISDNLNTLSYSGIDRRQSPARVRRRTKSLSNSPPFENKTGKEDCQSVPEKNTKVEIGEFESTSSEESKVLDSKFFLNNFFPEIRSQRTGLENVKPEIGKKVDSITVNNVINATKHLSKEDDNYYCRASRKLSKILEVEELKKEENQDFEGKKLDDIESKIEQRILKGFAWLTKTQGNLSPPATARSSHSEKNESLTELDKKELFEPKLISGSLQNSMTVKDFKNSKKEFQTSISERFNLFSNADNDDIIFLTAKCGKTELGLSKETSWMDDKCIQFPSNTGPNETVRDLDLDLKMSKEMENLKINSSRNSTSENLSTENSTRSEQSCKMASSTKKEVSFIESQKFRLALESSNNSKVEEKKVEIENEENRKSNRSDKKKSSVSSSPTKSNKNSSRLVNAETCNSVGEKIEVVKSGRKEKEQETEQKLNSTETIFQDFTSKSGRNTSRSGEFEASKNKSLNNQSLILQSSKIENTNTESMEKNDVSACEEKSPLSATSANTKSNCSSNRSKEFKAKKSKSQKPSPRDKNNENRSEEKKENFTERKSSSSRSREYQSKKSENHKFSCIERENEEDLNKILSHVNKQKLSPNLSFSKSNESFFRSCPFEKECQKFTYNILINKEEDKEEENKSELFSLDKTKACENTTPGKSNCSSCRSQESENLEKQKFIARSLKLQENDSSNNSTARLSTDKPKKESSKTKLFLGFEDSNSIIFLDESEVIKSDEDISNSSFKNLSLEDIKISNISSNSSSYRSEKSKRSLIEKLKNLESSSKRSDFSKDINLKSPNSSGSSTIQKPSPKSLLLQKEKSVEDSSRSRRFLINLESQNISSRSSSGHTNKKSISHSFQESFPKELEKRLVDLSKNIPKSSEFLNSRHTSPSRLNAIFDDFTERSMSERLKKSLSTSSKSLERDIEKRLEELSFRTPSSESTHSIQMEPQKSSSEIIVTINKPKTTDLFQERLITSARNSQREDEKHLEKIKSPTNSKSSRRRHNESKKSSPQSSQTLSGGTIRHTNNKSLENTLSKNKIMGENTEIERNAEIKNIIFNSPTTSSSRSISSSRSNNSLRSSVSTERSLENLRIPKELINTKNSSEISSATNSQRSSKKSQREQQDFIYKSSRRSQKLSSSSESDSKKLQINSKITKSKDDDHIEELITSEDRKNYRKNGNFLIIERLDDIENISNSDGSIKNLNKDRFHCQSSGGRSSRGKITFVDIIEDLEKAEDNLSDRSSSSEEEAEKEKESINSQRSNTGANSGRLTNRRLSTINEVSFENAENKSSNKLENDACEFKSKFSSEQSSIKSNKSHQKSLKVENWKSSSESIDQTSTTKNFQDGATWNDLIETFDGNQNSPIGYPINNFFGFPSEKSKKEKHSPVKSSKALLDFKKDKEKPEKDSFTLSKKIKKMENKSRSPKKRSEKISNYDRYQIEDEKSIQNSDKDIENFIEEKNFQEAPLPQPPQQMFYFDIEENECFGIGEFGDGACMNVGTPKIPKSIKPKDHGDGSVQENSLEELSLKSENIKKDKEAKHQRQLWTELREDFPRKETSTQEDMKILFMSTDVRTSKSDNCISIQKHEKARKRKFSSKSTLDSSNSSESINVEEKLTLSVRRLSSSMSNIVQAENQESSNSRVSLFEKTTRSTREEKDCTNFDIFLAQTEKETMSIKPNNWLTVKQSEEKKRSSRFRQFKKKSSISKEFLVPKEKHFRSNRRTRGRMKSLNYCCLRGFYKRLIGIFCVTSDSAATSQ